jgi:hypothetical protein
VSRDTFYAVRFVNLSVYELQVLQQIICIVIVLPCFGFGKLFTVILLPVEQGPSI